MNRLFFLSAVLAATAALAGCADYGHSYRDGYYQPAEGRYGDYYYNEPRRYGYPYYGYPYYGYPYYGGYYSPHHFGGFYPYGHHHLGYSLDYFGGYGYGGYGFGYGFDSHHHRFRDRHGDAGDHHEGDHHEGGHHEGGHHHGDGGHGGDHRDGDHRDEDSHDRRERLEPSAGDDRDRFIRRTPPDKYAPGTGYLMKVNAPRRRVGSESAMQPQPATRIGPLPAPRQEPRRYVSPRHSLPRQGEREHLVFQPREQPLPAPLRSAAPARPAPAVTVPAASHSQPVRQPRPVGFGKDGVRPAPPPVDRPAPTSRVAASRSPARADRSSDSDHEEE